MTTLVGSILSFLLLSASPRPFPLTLPPDPKKYGKDSLTIFYLSLVYTVNGVEHTVYVCVCVATVCVHMSKHVLL